MVTTKVSLTTFCHEDTKKSEGTTYSSLFFLRVFEKLRAFVAFGGLKSSTLAVTLDESNHEARNGQFMTTAIRRRTSITDRMEFMLQ